jgi:hypothetical protein
VKDKKEPAAKRRRGEPLPRLIKEPVATRTLWLEGSTLPKRPEVRLGRPEISPDGLSFRCPIQIHGLDGDKVRYIYGVDSMHALQLALKIIAARLHSYTPEGDERLYWFEEVDDLGFPEND